MHQNEIQQVIDGIIQVLEKGTIPMFVPPNYRPALRELAEARGDRVGSRKHKFEQAVKKLQPVLDAVLASPLSRQLDGKLVVWHRGEVYDVGRLLANWRMVCSFGPAQLPTPELHEKFEFTYVAEGGESVTEVARRFGYDNPGPLCHAPYFYSPYMRLKKDDKLFVPWPPRYLKYWIVASVKLQKMVLERLAEGIKSQHEAKEDFESFLIKIELISIVLSLGVSQIEGAALTAKAMSGTSSVAKEVTEEAIIMLTEKAGEKSVEILNLALEASHAPKTGIVFYLRHTAGLISPTYWASVYAACKTGELEAWLYGPEGVERKRIQQMTSQSQRELFELGLKIDFMRAQLESGLYKYRVTL
jgi:hypothetical protein